MDNLQLQGFVQYNYSPDTQPSSHAELVPGSFHHTAKYFCRDGLYLIHIIVHLTRLLLELCDTGTLTYPGGHSDISTSILARNVRHIGLLTITRALLPGLPYIVEFCCQNCTVMFDRQ